MTALHDVDLPRAQAMAASLAALLDRVEGAREVLPHLAALETSLRQHGAACLDHVTLPVLSKICAQLTSLPLPPADEPLQHLQSFLLRLVTVRAERPRRPPPAPTPPPPPMDDDDVLVVEMSHSEFLAATADQRGA